jgi:hypothetical protein
MKPILAVGSALLVLLCPGTLLAVDGTPATPYDSPPVPAAAPPSPRATQQIDPDVAPPPPPRPSSLSPSARLGGPSEGLLIGGELIVGSLTAAGLGVGGAYALSYAPPSSNGIPRSTTASTALNLGGLATLLASPFVVGRLVCAIGRLSVDYEAGCAGTIGTAYASGLGLWLVAIELTAHAPPPTCNECATTHNGKAELLGYVSGVALGAVIGWNLSKRKRDESVALHPINNAGPPPATLAAWTEPLVRTSQRTTVAGSGCEVPLIAFAF